MINIMKYENVFKDLSVTEAGELIISLFNYNKNKNINYKFSSVASACAFNKIKKDIEKKERISKIRSQAGKRGMNSRYSNR